MITIHFTRDSIGEEDLGAESSLDLEFNDDAKWNEIIPRIKNEQFLPALPEKDAVWTLEDSVKFGILSYFPRTDHVLHGINHYELASLCQNSHDMHFKYYPTRKERADEIYKINGFSKYCMWHEGWLVEWELCQ